MKEQMTQPNDKSLVVVEEAPVISYTQEQIQLIKDNYAKGASDTELQFFIEVAQRRGLDILSRQIYLIERWDGRLKRKFFSPETSIDGYRLIADRTGLYVPGDEPSFTYNSEGNVVSATAHVKKYVQGTWHEVTATAYWEEYVARTQAGDVTVAWKTKPRIMLGKCAEALALRKAFPAQLSGLYTREEMDQSENPTEANHVKQEAQVKTAKPAVKQVAPPKPEPKPAVTPVGSPEEQANLANRVILTDTVRALMTDFGFKSADLQQVLKDVTGKSKTTDLDGEELAVMAKTYSEMLAGQKVLAEQAKTAAAAGDVVEGEIVGEEATVSPTVAVADDLGWEGDDNNND
jgi:phage recombination protein Bet